MSRLPAGFHRLWAATAVSNIGDGVRTTALPLLATQQTSDPRLIAGVAVAQRVPWLLLILPGGVLADRHDRRNLRVRLDVFRAAVMAVLAVLVIAGSASIVAIFVVAALLAAAESTVDSSSMALVPALVDSDQLEQAAGRMSSTELVAGDLIGPPIGGLLFAAAVALPFGLDAASFLLAALIAASIPGSFRPPSDDSSTSSRSFRRELKEGFSWLWNQKLLRNLALVSVLLGFSNMVHLSIFVLFAKEELGLGPFGFGVILVPPSIGGVIGSIVTPRFRHSPLARTLTILVILGGCALVAIGFTTNVVLVALLLAVDSGVILAWNVLTMALRQRLIPGRLLGRVGASYRFLVFFGMPFGALAGGFIANAVSLPAAYVVAGALQLVAAIVVPFAVRSAGTSTPVDVHP